MKDILQSVPCFKTTCIQNCQKRIQRGGQVRRGMNPTIRPFVYSELLDLKQGNDTFSNVNERSVENSGVVK